MGGYGALLVAEKYPKMIAAVAAISPAVWTSYPQASAVNPDAYASAADFAANDVVTHTSALANTLVRAASGLNDPFHPGSRSTSAPADRDLAPAIFEELGSRRRSTERTDRSVHSASRNFAIRCANIG